MYKVSGTLTHGGKPIPNVEVVFFPDDTGKYRESFATTDDQGKFAMKYGAKEGVAPGGHTVFIRDPAVAMGMPDDQITDPEIVAALKKYGNEKTSPMKISVDKDLTDYELKLD